MEKGKLMMVIIIVLLVVLLGTVLAVSFYVMNLVSKQAEASGLNPQSEYAGKVLTQDEITKVTLGDAITTNLAKGPDNKDHVAKLRVVIGYDNTVKEESAAFEATINANLEYARAVALACIYSSTFEELSNPDGMANLANKIKEQLQDAFKTNLIVDVYFSERTLQ
jgi:flagellar basal body-associated protein FliL